MADGANAVGGVVVAANESGKSGSSAAVVTAAAASSVLFLLSAWNGHHWAAECERARRDHRDQEDIERQNRGIERQHRSWAGPAAIERFYCASAGTTSICTRNFASCTVARDEVLSQPAQIDVTPCEPAERAWCFDREPGAEQCFADRPACLTRAAKVFPDDATCDERM